MNTLLDFLQKLLLNVLGGLAAYQKGKDEASDEQTRKENTALKNGLDVALGGNYFPDALCERMRRTTTMPPNPPLPPIPNVHVLE